MQTRTTVQRALAGSAKETMERMLIHDHLYKAALTELKQFRNEVFVAGALVETVLEQMIVVEGDPAKKCRWLLCIQKLLCTQSSHHNEEFRILMWPGFIGGKEDSAALLALGSSFFSREVVIKSQGKGKKDNGKQRQLWFACVNTKGQLGLISSSSHYCHITPVSQELHWLPVRFRIKFKILLVIFKAIHGLGLVIQKKPQMGMCLINECMYVLKCIRSYPYVYCTI